MQPGAKWFDYCLVATSESFFFFFSNKETISVTPQYQLNMIISCRAHAMHHLNG